MIFTLLIPTLRSQTRVNSAESGQPGSDALPFLTDLFARYGHATTYDLEFTEESQFKGENIRNWNRALTRAALGPGNQYRFEHRGEYGDALQVSDGKTEWVYSPGLNQYTQQPTPSDGPSKLRSSAFMGLQRLSESRSTAHSISRLGEMIRSAKFAPDQDIQIAGGTIPCFVVTAEGQLPISETHITITFIFWVDKHSGLIRKSTSRREGELAPSEPGVHFVGEHEEIYTVAVIDPDSFPDGTFTFTPPATAVLVKQFISKESQELAKFVGKPLPTISVKDSRGRDVSLQSFQGKALLLDLWATWCEPCRESLPDLNKLYSEYKYADLVLVSLDEDEEAQKASDFWAQQKLPWPNYHLDRRSIDKFPPHGIPYFVLVDSSGTIVLSQAGLDENNLRTALNSLDSSPKTAPKTNR
jgi:outer membrane lipoprotein-sorting protein/thiol-disulfide isomerase/thioredoxin